MGLRFRVKGLGLTVYGLGNGLRAHRRSGLGFEGPMWSVVLVAVPVVVAAGGIGVAMSQVMLIMTSRVKKKVNQHHRKHTVPAGGSSSRKSMGSRHSFHSSSRRLLQQPRQQKQHDCSSIRLSNLNNPTT